MIVRAAAVMTLLLAAGCAAFLHEPTTPLAWAAHRGDVAEIRRLITAGADPNAYDATRQTALHWAARGGHEPGSHECDGEEATRADAVVLLIDLGAEVNALDRRLALPGATSGWTPLHVALHHRQFKTAARLLERGADPNIRTRQGTTAMAIAADKGGPPELLRMLIAKTPERKR